MIQTVDGEIFYLYAETIEEIIKQTQDFFSDACHENDLVAVDGYKDDIIYVSSMDLKNKTIDENCFVYFSVRMFKDARKNRHLVQGGVIPALNELGQPVCLLKMAPVKGYFHKYAQIKDAPDARVFSLYDVVVLMDVQEYAFILLKDALQEYKGRILCVGKDWIEFARLFPDRTNIEYIENKENIPLDVVRSNTMYLMEFSSIMAGHEERCKEGFFSYDEIMTLVYFFSNRTSYGEKNPDKKFFLIDPLFPMEGLMSICDKVQLPYSYAEANGFIPVIHLTQSNGSIYSDFDGDDIWKKFFEQPYGDIANEWKDSKNVWIFPQSTITFSDRWLMQKISDCREARFVNTFLINDRVKAEIDHVRTTALPVPERTIGVLIRGTDYTISHLPGHTIMASPEQVMEKIKEYENSGDYDWIFLSTEDEDILKKMIELCGDRLCYIDQKRFRINPNELLADQKKDRENDGWLKGKEYLTTLKLLSECGAFIASGSCCGTECALNSGADNFKETFIFNLGSY